MHPGRANDRNRCKAEVRANRRACLFKVGIPPGRVRASRCQGLICCAPHLTRPPIWGGIRIFGAVVTNEYDAGTFSGRIQYPMPEIWSQHSLMPSSANTA